MTAIPRPSPKATRVDREKVLASVAASLAVAREHLADREYREAVILALERATVGVRQLNERYQELKP
jgi:hypothetical protein